MRLFFIFLSICFLQLSACSYLNNKKVVVFVNSDPVGANIYVDDKFYGTTPRDLEVVPDKNYLLTVKKEGYVTKSVELKSENSFRLNARYDGFDTRRCVIDALGSVFVIPYIAFRSVYCRNFSQNSYNFDLDEMSKPISSATPDPLIPVIKNSYYPQEIQKAIQSKGDQASNALPQIPIFNNQSEFLNNGNSTETTGYQKRPIDYYNWQ